MSLTREKMAQRSEEGLPIATYPLRIRDDRSARADLAAAVASGEEQAIAAARASVQACYEQIQIQALPPERMETLLGAHKPTGQQEQDGAVYNPATFPAALLKACILDSDITESDWAEYLTKGPLSPGEANELFNAAWSVNYRSPDAWYPKGSTGTRNWPWS